MTEPVPDPSRAALPGGRARPSPTRHGRRLSHVRYRSAEEFFPEHEVRSVDGWHRFLYFAGISMQLGLSSYLIAIGFDDDWCKRTIAYRPAFALHHANLHGFDYDQPDMLRLASVLSPYWQWNGYNRAAPRRSDGGFTPTSVSALLRDLLDRVRTVTGIADPDVRT